MKSVETVCSMNDAGDAGIQPAPERYKSRLHPQPLQTGLRAALCSRRDVERGSRGGVAQWWRVSVQRGPRVGVDRGSRIGLGRCLGGVALAALLGLLLACSPAQEPADDAPPPLSRTLAFGADQAGFESVQPRPLQFPQDHGAHPRHRIEWWYVTARLHSAEGRRFGVQFALFRFALRPEDTATQAGWQGAQIYMLHAAVSDLDGNDSSGARFRSVERFARGAAALAGVELAPWRGWLGDCEARSTREDELFPLQLDCGGDDFRYRLKLEGGSPRVLHGEAGYSAKSELAGAASHYYAYPFIDAAGEIEIDGQTQAVRGQAWYDHEWTSSLLGADQVGWDWFSLRFSSGDALMLFHIRERSGAIVSSRGSLIRADGEVRTFSEGAVQAQAQGDWTSPGSGVRYPLQWRLVSTELDFDLTVRPSLESQEFSGTVRYWEGAIEAIGTQGGQAVSGEGYLELTGYDESGTRRPQ
jgi:predicted secreted hydrolase